MTATTGMQPAALARPLRQRRRPGLMALGVLMVVVSAMAVWYLVARAGGTVQAIVIRQDLQKGAVITNSDVEVVDVAQSNAYRVVPGNEIDDVVGQVARFEMLSGQLLVPDAYGPALDLPDGTAVIWITPSHRPMRELHAEDRVRLVFAGTAQSDIPGNLQAWDGKVVRTGQVTGTSGEEFCVEVEIAEEDADIVTAASASGRLALALVPGEPR